MYGIKKFCMILEKTQFEKCEDDYSDGERYCSMGVVAKELGFDPNEDNDFEHNMKQEIGEVPDDFYSNVIEFNDDECREKGFKCVAERIREQYGIFD